MLLLRVLHLADKLNIGALTTVPVDLSKLSNVVKNDVVKKAVYDKLAAEVNNVDTSDFALKTKYPTDKAELEKEIPDVTVFVKKTKLAQVEDKIPDASSLATKTALTTVENKIPSISSLVKKTDYDTKISALEKKVTDHDHCKYITIPDFNTLAAIVFNVRLAQANLLTKTDFDAKLSSINRKITSIKSKHLLVENELKNLKMFDSSYFRGKNYFENDGTQNYLVFQPMNKYFEITPTTNTILSWKSKACLMKLLNLLDFMLFLLWN